MEKDKTWKSSFKLAQISDALSSELRLCKLFFFFKLLLEKKHKNDLQDVKSENQNHIDLQTDV